MKRFRVETHYLIGGAVRLVPSQAASLSAVGG